MCTILKIIFNICKKTLVKTVNPETKTNKNKIENRITFKIKTGLSLKVLTPETLQLLARTKSKITKSDENVSPLEISEVVLTHCNIAGNIHQQNSRVLYTFIPNK